MDEWKISSASTYKQKCLHSFPNLETTPQVSKRKQLRGRLRSHGSAVSSIPAAKQPADARARDRSRPSSRVTRDLSRFVKAAAEHISICSSGWTTSVRHENCKGTQRTIIRKMLGAAVGVFEVRPVEAKKWPNSPGVSSRATLLSNIQMTQPSPCPWGTIRYRFSVGIGTDL